MVWSLTCALSQCHCCAHRQLCRLFCRWRHNKFFFKYVIFNIHAHTFMESSTINTKWLSFYQPLSAKCALSAQLRPLTQALLTNWQLSRSDRACLCTTRKEKKKLPQVGMFGKEYKTTLASNWKDGGGGLYAMQWNEKFEKMYKIKKSPLRNNNKTNKPLAEFRHIFMIKPFLPLSLY